MRLVHVLAVAVKLATCRCRREGLECRKTATQEDLLCDECRPWSGPPDDFGIIVFNDRERNPIAHVCFAEADWRMEVTPD